MNFKRGKIYSSIFILFLLTVYFASPKSVQAEDYSLLINEVFPNSLDRKLEFIELFNPSNSPLALTSCSITDATNKPFDLSQFSISSNSFLVLYGGGVNFSFQLNSSSAEIITLTCDNIQIDRLAYGNTATTPSNAKIPAKGQSLTRLSGRLSTSDNSFDFISANPSPGLPCILPEPKQYSKEIILSEFLPSPIDGSDGEFIEIYNKGVEQVDLSLWQLDDDGGSSPYVIPAGTVILPGQYLSYYHTETKIFLNDDGDLVRLISPDGNIISQTSYSLLASIEKGQSRSFFDDSWQWTTAPTPNSANLLSLKTLPNASQSSQPAIKRLSIEEAKKLSLGSLVIVNGFVTAPPVSISSQFFYLEDNTGGIQVYSYEKNFPALVTGEQLQITGALSQSNEEFRLKINLISDITFTNSPPDVNPSTNSVISTTLTLVETNDQANVGKYVAVTGQVLNPSGDQFELSDGPNSIKIVVKNSDLVQKPRLKSGDKIEVSGVLSRYRDTLRILPFEPGAVKIISSAQGESLPDAGLPTYFYFVLLVNLYFSWKLSQKMSRKPIMLPRRSPRRPLVATSFCCEVILGVVKPPLLEVSPWH